MFYEKELQFLCDVYRKHHLCAEVVPLSDFAAYLNTRETDAFFGAPTGEWSCISENGNFSANTVYRFTDGLERSCLFFLLPETKISSVLFVGPYLTKTISMQHSMEIGDAYGIPPQKQRYLLEYYSTIPVVLEESTLWVMLNTFCERIWHSVSFVCQDLDRPHTAFEFSGTNAANGNSAADTLVDMKALEQRYIFENEMMRSVSLGQLHMESHLRAAFDMGNLEKRVKDPLRNAKNYAIIMNTLFRKAAETGGVHPVYLDRVSSDFAVKLEMVSSVSAIESLMTEMFRVYCRLVRKHSVQKYSLVVQKTILLIDTDLSADLSPHSLAEIQGISLGYLSTVFKREIGETVTQYVWKKRIEYAKYLLSTTNLQIQTIALHCGILDVHYFSKMFKKTVGKTPMEYRQTTLQGSER